MNRDPRLLISIACNWLLYVALGQINSSIGSWNIHLHVIALYILFPLFYMEPLGALLSIAITGLFLDAATPVPFGFHFLMLLIFATVTRSLQRHIYRENATHVILVTIVINLLTALALTAQDWGPHVFTSVYWVRWGSDWLVSSFFCLFFAYRYIEFQRICTLSRANDLTEGAMEAVHRPFTPPRD